MNNRGKFILLAVGFFLLLGFVCGADVSHRWSEIGVMDEALDLEGQVLVDSSDGVVDVQDELDLNGFNITGVNRIDAGVIAADQQATADLLMNGYSVLEVDNVQFSSEKGDVFFVQNNFTSSSGGEYRFQARDSSGSKQLLLRMGPSSAGMFQDLDMNGNSLKNVYSVNPEGGNLGVGTSSPDSLLDVGGRYKVTKNIDWPGSDIPTALLIKKAGESARISGSLYGARSTGSDADTVIMTDFILSHGGGFDGFAVTTKGVLSHLDEPYAARVSYNGEEYHALMFTGTSGHYQPHDMSFVGTVDGNMDLQAVPASDVSVVEEYDDGILKTSGKMTTDELDVEGNTVMSGNISMDNMDKFKIGTDSSFWMDTGNTGMDGVFMQYNQGTDWTRIGIKDSSSNEAFTVYDAYYEDAERYGEGGWNKLFGVEDGGGVNVFDGNLNMNGNSITEVNDITLMSNGNINNIERISSDGDPLVVNNDMDMNSNSIRSVNSINPEGGNVGIGTTSPNAKLHVNSNTNTFGSFQQILHFNEDPGATYRYLHIKTPHQVTDGSIMRNFLIEGYAYGANEVISSRIVYYIYQDGLTSEQGVDLAGNSHNPSVYVGSDNYVYLRIDIGTTYYASFSLFANEAANGGGYSTSGWEVTQSDSSTL